MFLKANIHNLIYTYFKIADYIELVIDEMHYYK